MISTFLFFTLLICQTESFGREVKLSDKNLRLNRKPNSLEVFITAFGKEFHLHLTIQESPVKFSRNSKLTFYSGEAQVANGKRHKSGKATLTLNESKSIEST